MREKTCCVTGHRDIPAEKVEYVKQELHREIRLALADGYRCFVSGFAEGADQLFMECVIEARKENQGSLDILLETAIPYKGRLDRLSEKEVILLAESDGMKIICDEYRRSCYTERNTYMVAQSSRVIAVYDGRDKGGTVQTIRIAHKQEIKVRVISI